jgi:hypothetical protein
MNVANYFSFLQSKLWGDLQGLIALAFIIGFISCIMVQAIKQADKTVFLQFQLTKNPLFIINSFLNLIITIIIILVFDGMGAWYFTGLYILLIWLFSWALSIIGYEYFLKYVFKLFDLIDAGLNYLIKKLQ